MLLVENVEGLVVIQNFISRALQRCRSLAKIFSNLTKNGRLVGGIITSSNFFYVFECGLFNSCERNSLISSQTNALSLLETRWSSE